MPNIFFVFFYFFLFVWEPLNLSIILKVLFMQEFSYLE